MIYDGRCGFCSATVRVLRSIDWRDTLYFVPSQTPRLLQVAGIAAEDAERSSLLLTPGGQLFHAGGTLAATFDELLPWGLPLFRALYLLPGLQQLADAIYHFVSRHRGSLGHYRADLGEDPPSPLDRQTIEEIRRRHLAEQMPSALPPHPWIH